MMKATFAAGCFWGVEHSFREVEGVSDAVSGYTGGTAENPTYKQVCSGSTGHAEAVEVTFDPDVVSYEQLLALFWSIHNPTTRDRQGWDIGSQYRSAIFYHSEEQRQAAEASRDAAQTHLGKQIVTQIVPGLDLLAGRGLPPALRREERPGGLQDHRARPGRAGSRAGQARRAHRPARRIGTAVPRIGVWPRRRGACTLSACPLACSPP